MRLIGASPDGHMLDMIFRTLLTVKALLTREP